VINRAGLRNHTADGYIIRDSVVVLPGGRGAGRAGELGWAKDLRPTAILWQQVGLLGDEEMGDWIACDEAGLPVGGIVRDAKAMTEQGWLSCENHQTMLAFLVTWGASSRKLRLFACACCRRIWHQFKRSVPSKRAVEVAERYADGLATDEELTAAREAAKRAWSAARMSYVHGQARRAAAYAASNDTEQLAYTSTAAYMGIGGGKDVSAHMAAQQAERATHPARIRCIFGNTLLPAPAVDPAWQAWNDGAIRKLAEAIYQQRRFADLPILADALEEAGCSEAAILAHCHSGGEHVRGCWVVDLLTGRQ
jgi:hypothetical protein